MAARESSTASASACDTPRSKVRLDIASWEVPARYQGARLRQMRAAVRDAVSPGLETASYYIHGDVGVGKTHLAAAILVESVYRRVARDPGSAFSSSRASALFVSAPCVLQRIKRSWQAERAEAGYERYAVSRLKRRRAVVIDDIFAGKFSDWAGGVLFEVIDHRYANRLPTILTGNLGLDEMHSLDPRIASRVASFRVVCLGGEDRRVAEGMAERERAG